ncbi:MAG: TSUP family transporter [Rhodocyclaceae bacterium]|nr:TSUP family transporter [Rhodocyclaceae bacterium]
MFEWIVHLPISGTEINGFALILLGFTVGVIGGFFGVGGAFMVTPALNVFGFPMAYAIGTDMAHIAGKSIVATFKHRKFGNVDMKLGALMIIGTVIGIELGATLIMWLEKIGRIGPIVRTTYVILLFGLGFYMWYEYVVTARRAVAKGAQAAGSDTGKSRLALRMQKINLPPMIHLKVSGFSISLWVIVGVGMFTGFLAGFLGVGGGFIRMPALMYLIGSPTKVAVGTDLFEVMFSGAYGAFTYALKARVELLAALIMLIGAAVGAQIGATATLYARGTIIRLYFAITMICAGISVIFKHLAEQNKDIYRGALNEWAKAVSGIADRTELGVWLHNNKEAAKSWMLEQPDLLQQAHAAEKTWSSYSGYLMLGSACGLSAVIIFWLVRGVMRERAEARETQAEIAMVAEGAHAGMVIAASCTPNDLPAVRMGAQIAGGMKCDTTLLVCEEAGVCEPTLQEGRKTLERYGLPPKVVFATGTPYKEILERSADARLLVIGSRPLSGFEPKYHLGDNATRIVRHMTTSTLVVRGREQVKRILLCLDLPHSKATVRMARDVALATDASVELLYVASLPTLYTPEIPPEVVDTLERVFLHEFHAEKLEQLDRIGAELSAAGVKQVTIKLREGFVEEEIIKESVEGDFDLIVLKEGFLKTPFGMWLSRLSTNIATRSPQASVLIVKR